MTLSNALKVKNRLIGQLNKVRADIQAHNSVCKDRELDIEALWKESEDLEYRVVQLKSAISVATAKITPKLVELAECKSKLAFINGLFIRSGEELELVSYGSPATKTTVWSSFITETRKRELIKEAEGQIAWLQDSIDEYNGTTILGV